MKRVKGSKKRKKKRKTKTNLSFMSYGISKVSRGLKIDDAHPQTTETINRGIHCWPSENEYLHEDNRKS